MRRRTFVAAIAGVGTTALAGCGGESGVTEWLTYAPATPTLIVTQWTSGVDSESVAPFVDRIVAQGSVEVAGRNLSEAVAAGGFLNRTVRHDGGVYEFRRRRVATETFRDYRITVLYNYENDGPKSISQNPDPNESVAFDSLPAVDRRKLAGAFPIPNGTLASMRDNGATPGLPGDTDVAYSTEIEARYRETERARSELVDPPATSVAYNGTVYEVLVEPAAERTVVTYRYSVAERWTLEAFAERLAAEHAIPGAAFTEPERRVIDEVLESGAYPVDDDDRARSLIETLHGYPGAEVVAHEVDPVGTPTFRPPWRKTAWLVRIRGENYALQHFEKTYD